MEVQGLSHSKKLVHFFLNPILQYGINYHMVARLIYHEKYVYIDGAIREMVLWQLPDKTTENPHGLKYRLYYGLADGSCVVRYDNETGKGDHKHIGNRQELYPFKDVETLVAHFLEDIEKTRRA